MSATGLFGLAGTELAVTPSGSMAFRRAGPRGELPLLLCIRFRGTIDDWDPALLTVLASDRDVVVFDGPGIGHSAGAAASTVAEMAAGALELVSALDLRAVDLLGWSLGGFVAQSIALTHPALVGRLIIAGSKPGPVPGAPARDPKVGKVAGKPVNDAEDLLYLFFPPSPKGRAAGVASLERISATPDPAVVSSAAVHAQSAALMSWSSGAESAWDRLEELEMPILIAAGAQDRLMDAYHSYAMIRRLPNANLLIYGDAGHAFLFQHPEQFGRQAIHFLTRR
jgi:pimeloyl-ACP methyl ester carboxylesterase